ncbi:MerR family DNA-binding transcriptional regulator [Paenibacillus sp. Z3-2]
MGVSVHQIRYFEEKGILLPSYIDENQYRMYSLDEMYQQLAHILLLRKVGLSVQAIRNWKDEGTPTTCSVCLYSLFPRWKPR